MMFCTVCIGAHMTGTTSVDGYPSFKRDALRKHEKSKTHQKAEAILASMKRPITESLAAKSLSALKAPETAKLEHLFRTAHARANKGRPF